MAQFFTDLVGRGSNDNEDEATHYIWRTVGDDKVREEHAAREDKVFAYDNPPEGGNPGEDYNCCCWAEPIEGRAKEEQYLLLDLLMSNRELNRN
mgnify:CR=1 FL=1